MKFPLLIDPAPPSLIKLFLLSLRCIKIPLYNVLNYRNQRFLHKIRLATSNLFHPFPDFQFHDQPLDWLQNLRKQLTLFRRHEQQDFYSQKQNAWRSWARTNGLSIVRKIYQLVKGKPVEPFTCLQHHGSLVTDRTDLYLLSTLVLSTKVITTDPLFTLSLALFLNFRFLVFPWMTSVLLFLRNSNRSSQRG